jgi:uncharacterized membrane protein
MVTKFIARWNIKRWCRHLCALPSAVKKHFSHDAIQRIEAAIASSEALHSGEIRFAVEAKLSFLELIARKTAQQRVLEVFSELRVWDTAQNNGVLIYLLVADHDFEILADRGIHQHVGSAGWAQISHQMELMFRQGQFEAGVIYGISKISEHLIQHYPAKGENHNELPNTPVIL